MTLTRRDVLSAGLLLSSALGCRRLEEAVVGPLWPEEPYAGPFSAPAGLAIDPVRHALNRLSFGPRPEDEAQVRALGTDPKMAIRAYLEQQLDPESLDDTRAERAVRRLETLSQPAGELFEYKPKVLLDELTRGTLLRAVYSRRQLYEVMVQFWTDHFNIDASKGDCKWLKVADDRDVIRRHALDGSATCCVPRRFHRRCSGISMGGSTAGLLRMRCRTRTTPASCSSSIL